MQPAAAFPQEPRSRFSMSPLRMSPGSPRRRWQGCSEGRCPGADPAALSRTWPTGPPQSCLPPPRRGLAVRMRSSSIAGDGSNAKSFGQSPRMSTCWWWPATGTTRVWARTAWAPSPASSSTTHRVPCCWCGPMSRRASSRYHRRLPDRGPAGPRPGSGGGRRPIRVFDGWPSRGAIGQLGTATASAWATNSGWSSTRSQVPSGCLRATCARAPAASLGGVEVSAMSPQMRVGSAVSCSR